MPVRKVPLQLIPTGLDTKASPFHVSPGAFTIAENVRFKRRGEVRKRTALSPSLAIDYATAAFTARRLVGIAYDGASYYAQSEFAGDASARNSYTVYKYSGDFWGKHLVGANAICETSITKSGTLQPSPMGIVSAIELPNGMRSEFSAAASSTTTAATSVQVSATQAVHLWLVPGASNSTIWARLCTYTPASGNYPETDGFVSGADVSVCTLVVGTSAATPLFDAVYLSTTGEIMIAFRSSATSYRINSLNPTTFAANAKTVTVASDSNKVIAFLEQDESGGRLYLGVAGSTAGVRVMEHSISTLAQSGTQTMLSAHLDARQITGYRSEATTTTGVVVEAYGTVTAGYRGVQCAFYVGTGTGTGSLGSAIANAGLYSRAFTWSNYNGADVYLQYAIVTDGSIQTTVYVCNWGPISYNTPGVYVYQTTSIGRALADAASGPLPYVSCLPRVSYPSANVRTWNCLARRSFDVSGSTFVTDLTSYRFAVDLDCSNLSSPAGLGGLHYPGGMLATTAGEDCIGYYPEIVSVVGGAGGSLTTVGAYSYTAIYRRTSDTGDVHRSAQAFSVLVTLTGAQQSTTLVVKTPPVQLRIDFGAQLWLDVYRTAAGGDGTAYYRCASVAVSPGATPTTSVVDAMSDVALIAKEKLYTTGNVLENVAPPSSRIVVAWKNRLVAVQRRGAWISKEYSPGFGVGFSDTITIGLNDPGGDIHAAVVMDDRLYFHRPGGIWALVGEGPDDTGGGPGYDLPVRVSEVPGALGPRLATTCPLGMVWVNAQGVQLLDRGHIVQFLGAPIEFLLAPASATRIVYMDTAQEIRVFTTSFVDYVYDLIAQAWSADRHSYTTTTDAVAAAGGLVAVYPNGGSVYYETSNSYQDQGLNAYAMKIKTGRITPAGVAGFSSLYEIVLTGEVMAACSLLVTVTLYYDTLSSVETFPFAAAVGRLSEGVKIRHQRCTAFEVQVEESPASTGAAIRLEQITAWVGIMAGTTPLRTAGRGTP